jgi:hypothetical protein
MDKSVTIENGYCFVLMPFAERFNEVYDAISEAVEGPDVNFSCHRADELFGGGHIIEDILRCTAKAEIVIADLTTKNPNVFYELGIVHMVKSIEKVLIITQSMEDIPFDLRHFRCIVYDQSPSGLRQLKRQLIDSILQVAQRKYRFSVRRGERYKFQEQLPGPDRCLYDFEISDVMTGRDFAKFLLTTSRHAIGEPVTEVHKGCGMSTGESAGISPTPWLLKLERVSHDVANFCVIPDE